MTIINLKIGSVWEICADFLARMLGFACAAVNVVLGDTGRREMVTIGELSVVQVEHPLGKYKDEWA